MHYLEHIKKVWYRLLNGDKTALQKVDQVTVKALELRAPRYSRQDALHLQGKLLSGQIFGAFSREKREEIWSELCTIDGLIPSLFTFFEDVKYLSACSDCVKRLVKLSRRDTILTALRRNFSGHGHADGRIDIEVANSSFVAHTGTITDTLDLGYRQLWLFAMRNYRGMPAEPRKRTKDLLAKAGVQKADEVTLSEITALARRLGFDSREIQVREQLSSDKEIIRAALLKARKPDRFEYEESTLEALITQTVDSLMHAAPRLYEPSSPSLASENPDASGRRCGFPDEDAQKQDSRYLFLPYLHKTGEEQGEDVTSYFVRRSVYMAFFGETAELKLDWSSPIPQKAVFTENLEATSTYDSSQMDESRWMEQQEFRRTTTGEGAMREQHLEQARLEQARLEQARLEQARLEQARLEQARLEQARLEQARLEQESLSRARQLQKRLEQERQEQVHQNKERESQEPEWQDAKSENGRGQIQRGRTQHDMQNDITRGGDIDQSDIFAIKVISIPVITGHC